MELKLEKAKVSDAKSIFDIQISSFKPLLEKYKDYNFNPGNESIARVLERISNPNGGFYKILLENILVGAICVYWKEKRTQLWISPMFILPKYQGKGIAQKAIILVENLFSHATSWELATILEEERNCYLYEKMGFSQTGESKKLNDETTLIFYRKDVEL